MTAKLRLDVHLYVTPRCNLSCPHCYYDALDRTQHPDNLMSLVEISGILTALAQRFNVDTSLEGGEPFLRVGVDTMLGELGPAVLASLTVTTNGTILIKTEPEVLRKLGGLRVSIDGHTDELQRELRGVDLAPVLRTCHDLRRADVPFTARMTLWKRNIGVLADIYTFVADNELERLSLFEYQASGRGIGQELLYGVSEPAVVTFLDDLMTLPRPKCLRLLTVNFADRRVDLVARRRQRLIDHGVSVVDLPETPNCTINFDGTVGISPWRVTAEGAPDVFTTTSAPDFLDVVSAAAASGGLRDDSGCLSRIQLRLAL